MNRAFAKLCPPRFPRQGARSHALIAAILMLFACGDAMAASARSHAQAMARPSERADGATEVILLRGLLNVFSLGMDELAGKLRAMGVRAQVSNHAAWSSLAADLVEARRAGRTGRIVLIGHSLGGNDVIRMATTLGRAGVPVDLLIPIDATSPDPVPANVGRAVNYYQSGNGWGSAIRPGGGFRGRLVNADLMTTRRDLNDGSIGHVSIDKSSRIHAEILAMVRQLGPGQRRVATRPVARPAARAVVQRPDRLVQAGQ